MWDAFLKVIFLIAILPYYMFQKGYGMLERFMEKHDYPFGWEHKLLYILIILLIVAFFVEYGYH